MESGTIAYRKSRFGTRLPVGLRYTRAHYWLLEAEPGLWRAGFTKFATRMLGDLVDFGFSPSPGTRVELGAVIGWVEGFKAVTDVYAVAAGEFIRVNPATDRDISLIDSDPYERGWLYEIRGKPDPGALDVQGYISVLDATIDKMLASRHDEPEECAR
ncbi:MAG: glycine cleavage system protein H [Acidobacteria bacterium]|nr:glycine cleavage system protein H [Acidobacteriota bacterium]